MAMILPAPRSALPATDIRPTGPMPMTTTVSPQVTCAISTPWKPVVTMSEAMSACS